MICIMITCAKHMAEAPGIQPVTHERGENDVACVLGDCRTLQVMVLVCGGVYSVRVCAGWWSVWYLTVSAMCGVLMIMFVCVVARGVA